MSAKTVMVATLGGQPQVVTFALDALLDRDEPVEEVYILHLSPENLSTRRSLVRLAQEFPNDTYGLKAANPRKESVS